MEPRAERLELRPQGIAQRTALLLARRDRLRDLREARAQRRHRAQEARLPEPLGRRKLLHTRGAEQLADLVGDRRRREDRGPRSRRSEARAKGARFVRSPPRRGSPAAAAPRRPRRRAGRRRKRARRATRARCRAAARTPRRTPGSEAGRCARPRAPRACARCAPPCVASVARAPRPSEARRSWRSDARGRRYLQVSSAASSSSRSRRNRRVSRSGGAGCRSGIPGRTTWTTSRSCKTRSVGLSSARGPAIRTRAIWMITAVPPPPSRGPSRWRAERAARRSPRECSTGARRAPHPRRRSGRARRRDARTPRPPRARRRFEERRVVRFGLPRRVARSIDPGAGLLLCLAHARFEAALDL